jgi:hypothetical protein
MKSMKKTGGVSNQNTPAEVSPKTLGVSPHGLNGTAMISPTSQGNPLSRTNLNGDAKSSPTARWGMNVSKDIKNMRDTLMEMPDGRPVSKKAERD